MNINTAFEQSVRVVDETVRKIKAVANGGAPAADLERLVTFLEKSLRKQHDLVLGDVARVTRDTFDSLQQPAESTGDYASRLRTTLNALSHRHEQTLSELDYHRRMHQACHKEVARLRKILRALHDRADASLPSEPLSERVQRKIAVKLTRYLNILTTIHQSIQTQATLSLDDGGAGAMANQEEMVKLQQDIKMSRDLLLSVHASTDTSTNDNSTPDETQLIESISTHINLFERVLDLERQLESAAISRSTSQHSLTVSEARHAAGLISDDEPFPCEFIDRDGTVVAKETACCGHAATADKTHSTDTADEEVAQLVDETVSSGHLVPYQDEMEEDGKVVAVTIENTVEDAVVHEASATNDDVAVTDNEAQLKTTDADDAEESAEVIQLDAVVTSEPVITEPLEAQSDVAVEDPFADSNAVENDAILDEFSQDSVEQEEVAEESSNVVEVQELADDDEPEVKLDESINAIEDSEMVADEPSDGQEKIAEPLLTFTDSVEQSIVSPDLAANQPQKSDTSATNMDTMVEHAVADAFSEESPAQDWDWQEEDAEDPEISSALPDNSVPAITECNAVDLAEMALPETVLSESKSHSDESNYQEKDNEATDNIVDSLEPEIAADQASTEPKATTWAPEPAVQEDSPKSEDNDVLVEQEPLAFVTTSEDAEVDSIGDTDSLYAEETTVNEPYVHVTEPIAEERAEEIATLEEIPSALDNIIITAPEESDDDESAMLHEDITANSDITSAFMDANSSFGADEINDCVSTFSGPMSHSVRSRRTASFTSANSMFGDDVASDLQSVEFQGDAAPDSPLPAVATAESTAFDHAAMQDYFAESDANLQPEVSQTVTKVAVQEPASNDKLDDQDDAISTEMATLDTADNSEPVDTDLKEATHAEIIKTPLADEEPAIQMRQNDVEPASKSIWGGLIDVGRSIVSKASSVSPVTLAKTREEQLDEEMDEQCMEVSPSFDTNDGSLETPADDRDVLASDHSSSLSCIKLPLDEIDAAHEQVQIDMVDSLLLDMKESDMDTRDPFSDAAAIVDDIIDVSSVVDIEVPVDDAVGIHELPVVDQSIVPESSSDESVAVEANDLVNPFEDPASIYRGDKDEDTVPSAALSALDEQDVQPVAAEEAIAADDWEQSWGDSADEALLDPVIDSTAAPAYERPPSFAVEKVEEAVDDEPLDVVHKQDENKEATLVETLRPFAPAYSRPPSFMSEEAPIALAKDNADATELPYASASYVAEPLVDIIQDASAYSCPPTSAADESQNMNYAPTTRNVAQSLAMETATDDNDQAIPAYSRPTTFIDEEIPSYDTESLAKKEANLDNTQAIPAYSRPPTFNDEEIPSYDTESFAKKEANLDNTQAIPAYRPPTFTDDDLHMDQDVEESPFALDPLDADLLSEHLTDKTDNAPAHELEILRSSSLTGPLTEELLAEHDANNTPRSASVDHDSAPSTPQSYKEKLEQLLDHVQSSQHTLDELDEMSRRNSNSIAGSRAPSTEPADTADACIVPLTTEALREHGGDIMNAAASSECNSALSSPKSLKEQLDDVLERVESSKQILEDIQQTTSPVHKTAATEAAVAPTTSVVSRSSTWLQSSLASFFGTGTTSAPIERTAMSTSSAVDKPASATSDPTAEQSDFVEDEVCDDAKEPSDALESADDKHSELDEDDADCSSLAMKEHQRQQLVDAPASSEDDLAHMDSTSDVAFSRDLLSDFVLPNDSSLAAVDEEKSTAEDLVTPTMEDEPSLGEAASIADLSTPVHKYILPPAYSNNEQSLKTTTSEDVLYRIDAATCTSIKDIAAEIPLGTLRTTNSEEVLREIDNALDRGIRMTVEDHAATTKTIEDMTVVMAPAAPLNVLIVENVPTLTASDLAAIKDNPAIPESIRQALLAVMLAQQHPEKSQELSSAIAERQSLKQELAAKTVEVQGLQQRESALQKLSRTLEAENDALTKANRGDKINNQRLLTQVRALTEQIHVLSSGGDAAVRPHFERIDIGSLNLLARLKRIWHGLMELYLDSNDIPDLAAISDIDFVLDQIEISTQILGSYVDANVHASLHPLDDKTMDELSSAVKDIKKRRVPHPIAE